MMHVVVGGLMLITSRGSAVELFSPSLRKLWKVWQLRAMVFLSLAAQIILVVFGNRRRCNPRAWTKILTWWAYLLADAVAAVALGILSNNLGEIYEEGGKMGSNDQLTAFWAPFFLVHLGGPDTITAYSIEDNELYLRHGFRLVSQAIVTIYVFLMGWTSSRLSFLGIPIIIAGCIKYGERVRALWLASRDKLRDSMLLPLEFGPNHPKFMDEYCLKHEEGDRVDTIRMKETDQVDRWHEIEDATKFTRAKFLFYHFKRLFADLILSYEQHEKSRALFSRFTDAGQAFDVVEIELGFMYDMLYTKAAVIYTRWGVLRRAITICLSIFAFLVFSLEDFSRYKKVDVAITFTLLSVAILLEVYAVLIMLFSDQTHCWWIQLSKWLSTVSRRLNGCGEQPDKDERSKQWNRSDSRGSRKILGILGRLFKIKRWSRRMGQYNMLSVVLNEHPGSGFLGCFFQKLREKYRYKSYKDADEVKDIIFSHINEKHRQLEGAENVEEGRPDEFSPIRDSCSNNGQCSVLDLRRKCGVDVGSLTYLEFDERILALHLATEICYYEDHEEQNHRVSEEKNTGKSEGNDKLSRYISRYMLYLLVMYPALLPVGIGLVRFRETCEEARGFLRDREAIFSADEMSAKKLLRLIKNWLTKMTYCVKAMFGCILGKNAAWKGQLLWRRRRESRVALCKRLGKVYVDPIRVKGDRNKSVLFDGIRLASELTLLEHMINKEFKWKVIRDVWLEMLTYAASKGRGSDHVEQLCRGGELLTHVWLLMAHFGVTEHFQISEGHARARLSVT